MLGPTRNGWIRDGERQLLKRARKVIAEAEQLAVTSRAYQDVLDALANPPQPTAALILAMREYEAAGIRWP